MTREETIKDLGRLAASQIPIVIHSPIDDAEFLKLLGLDASEIESLRAYIFGPDLFTLGHDVILKLNDDFDDVVDGIKSWQDGFDEVNARIVKAHFEQYKQEQNEIHNKLNDFKPKG